MRFSYSAIWDEAVRMLKAHASLLVAIAGAFLFLPEMFAAYLLPMPEADPNGGLVALMRTMLAYTEANWLPLLLVNLVGSAGSIAMLTLLFDRDGVTVGEALKRAMPLLIPYVIASFLANLMIGAGCFVFVVPGLYLLGRLAPVTPAVVAEGLRNPIEALRRAFGLTQGAGWKVAGLVLVISLAGLLVVFASSSVIGALLILLAGQQIGTTLSLILDAALGAALTTVLLALYAAIYLQLSAAQLAGGRSSGI